MFSVLLFGIVWFFSDVFRVLGSCIRVLCFGYWRGLVLFGVCRDWVGEEVISVYVMVLGRSGFKVGAVFGRFRGNYGEVV